MTSMILKKNHLRKTVPLNKFINHKFEALKNQIIYHYREYLKFKKKINKQKFVKSFIEKIVYSSLCIVYVNNTQYAHFLCVMTDFN